MNKEKFIKIVSDAMNELPLEKKKDFLYKTHEWIEYVEKELDKELEKYHKCSTCNQYFLIEKAEKFQEVETKENVLLHCDAGYGDDDIIGDAKYLTTYLICPICKTKNEIKQDLIISYNEHRRGF